MIGALDINNGINITIKYLYTNYKQINYMESILNF